MFFLIKISNLICTWYNNLENLVIHKLTILSKREFYFLSASLFMLFNLLSIIITYIIDLFILFCILSYFIKKRNYFIFFKYIVNEIIDKIIFFLLIYYYKYLYFFLFTFYLLLKYIYNTENIINNKYSIVEWIVYIDNFIIDYLDKKKLLIINKLNILNNNNNNNN